MATTQEYVNAAKKMPSARDAAEQALVDKGKIAGMQEVSNADHEAKRQEKINGAVKK